MMGEDETGTAEAVRERREAAEAVATAHGGRLFKTMGDALFIEFPSVVAAVECAIAIQNRTAERNAGIPEDKRILYRIGVNLGDVLVDGDDLLGDGVNIAARLEGIAEPGGVCLSRVAYGLVRGKIAAEFLDLGEQTLKNIARPVRVYAVTGPAQRAPPPAGLRPAAPPRLSLVVLPFANFGGGAEEESFADGVTESLTTDLSRMSAAFVIAWNTAFTYKGKPTDARRLGRELGVRFVLEGSVQRVGDRMRVNAQLIEAETGAHLWAERFDKPVANLLDMQDEIVARIVNAFVAEIVRVEARRAEQAQNPDAADFWVRGFDLINRGVSPDSLAKARQAFERALEIDPESVFGLLGVVLSDVILAQICALEDRSERVAAAARIVQRVLAVDPRNPMAHNFMGFILVLSNRADQGIAEFNQALSLDPNQAFAHANIATAKIALGRAEEAEAHVAEAMRLSPQNSGLYVWRLIVGLAKLHLGDDKDAVAWCRKSVEANRTYAFASFHLAAGLALGGETQAAQLEAQSASALQPDFTLRRYRDGALGDNPTYLAQRERIMEGLRLAGVPE
jgi:TolB-like protein